MRIIPGKTKVEIELFRGISIADMVISAVGLGLCTLIAFTNLPLKLLWLTVFALITVLLLVRLDDEPNYKLVLHIMLHTLSYRHHFVRIYDDNTLREMHKDGHEKVAFDKVFEEKHSSVKVNEKARKKAEKAERKADDKLLKSHKLSKEQEDAIWLKRAKQAEQKKLAKQNSVEISPMSDIIGFVEIADGFVHYKRGYYGAAIEIPPVEFRFFSPMRRNSAIENSFGAVLRNINPEYAANIVKINRPIYYDSYIKREHEKVEALRRSFENGVLKEEEFQSRVEIIYDRINDLEAMNNKNRVVDGAYYLVLYDRDRNQLRNRIFDALRDLQNGGMNPHWLDSKELAVFLKYTNDMNFDEREIDNILPSDYAAWAQPEQVDVRNHTVAVNQILTHNMRVVSYPLLVGDAWLAGVMSLPSTKVVIKCQTMERGRAIRAIDHSLQELRGQYASTGVDSKRIELQNHIDTLEETLSMLKSENEQLLSVNVYVTAYDIVASRKDPMLKPSENSPLIQVNNLKKMVLRIYRENGFRLNSMQFCQSEAFVGGQVNGYDPLSREGRGMPSNTVAATFPWIFAHICDKEGIKFGESEGIPIFIDFFRRDNERVNSNLVVVGKSGSGKSYSTKSILTNLAAEDSKIFVLDPENEYTELAQNLHGKFINVGNAQYGRLNPFQIITALDDDDEGSETTSGSYATHLQFLEEFFKQILPDCDKDALEYLNSMIDRLYTNMGITAETDLRRLRPEDYPVFDNLYDTILMEFQSTDNDYIRTMLRSLMNYISKFSTGGRNANIWNGPSTVTTDENFTVFNFQSLLANRNGTVGNAQMLLVLKYIDNEIIKNREYNKKYNAKRKVIVVIDEAHVFIDTKYPVALDFMFQLAKRIRKYNGMQIVITQNIKDFVGSEEIARKSTAIINACQYSFIFSLAPNDMDDLCRLYEKAGGINESEQDQIINAARGQAFTIMSPQSRSSFQVKVPSATVDMFQENDYQTHYFHNEEGKNFWENFVTESRVKFAASYEERHPVIEEDQNVKKQSAVSFIEVTEEELDESRSASSSKIAEPTAKLEQSVSAFAPAPSAATNSELTGIVSQLTGMVNSMKNFSYDAIMSRMQEMLNRKIAEGALVQAAEQNSDDSDAFDFFDDFNKPIESEASEQVSESAEPFDFFDASNEPDKSGEETEKGSDEQDVFDFFDDVDTAEKTVETGSAELQPESETSASEQDSQDYDAMLDAILAEMEAEEKKAESLQYIEDDEKIAQPANDTEAERNDSATANAKPIGNIFDVTPQEIEDLSRPEGKEPAESATGERKIPTCLEEMETAGVKIRAIRLCDLTALLQALDAAELAVASQNSI